MKAQLQKEHALELATLKATLQQEQEAKLASDSHLDLGRAPYIVYGVNYIDPVSLAQEQEAKLAGQSQMT